MRRRRRRRGGGGETQSWTFLLFSFNTLPSFLSLFLSFFFPAGFERKYLTKGAFVCFQMIDFGIWATPLAVQWLAVNWSVGKN